MGTNVIPAPSGILIDSASEECNKANINYKEQSGEYKRHVVYAALIKKFPKIPKRQIALAIETVLNVQA